MGGEIDMRYKRELKDACYNCGYLHQGKTAFYKCHCGDCPAIKKEKYPKEKNNKNK